MSRTLPSAFPMPRTLARRGSSPRAGRQVVGEAVRSGLCVPEGAECPRAVSPEESASRELSVTVELDVAEQGLACHHSPETLPHGREPEAEDARIEGSGGGTDGESRSAGDGYSGHVASWCQPA